MPYLVQQYVRGARNALTAAFDGVEVHAANGCLLDQFIESSTNRRSDEYGGSIENRARLLMEVAEAVSDVWCADRAGVRLSPLGMMNDISDDDPETTFRHVAEKLNDYRLAYLHIINPAIAAPEKEAEPEPRALRMLDRIRERYQGILMIAGGFDRDTAEAWLEQVRLIRSPSAASFSPIPTCRNASGHALPSMQRIDPPSTAAGPKAIPTTRPSGRNEVSSRDPAWMSTGDRPYRSSSTRAAGDEYDLLHCSVLVLLKL